MFFTIKNIVFILLLNITTPAYTSNAVCQKSNGYYGQRLLAECYEKVAKSYAAKGNQTLANQNYQFAGRAFMNQGFAQDIEAAALMYKKANKTIEEHNAYLRLIQKYQYELDQNKQLTPTYRAVILTKLAQTYAKTNQSIQSMKCYEESIFLRKKVAASALQRSDYWLAGTIYDNVAKLCVSGLRDISCKKSALSKAIAAYEKHLNKVIIKRNCQEYTTDNYRLNLELPKQKIENDLNQLRAISSKNKN